MSNAKSVISVVLIACLTCFTYGDVSDLVKSLTTGSKEERVHAARELAELGSGASPAVSALANALKSSDKDLRRAAALALASIGADARGAVPALVNSLTDQDAGVRACAAHGLGAIGDSSEPTVAALIGAGLDTNATVRREVRDALRAINAPSEVTLPLWVSTLRDADPRVVMPALHTLAESGRAAVPGLRQALQHDEACYWACLAIAELGPDAKDLVPEVQEILKHRHPECRMQALVSLGEIGPGAKAAVPSIVALLEKEEFDSVRYAAAYALGQLDNSSAAQEALKKLIQNEDAGLRAIAAWSLLKINPDAAGNDARKAIIAALGSKDAEIRQIAIRALTELPPRDDALDEEVVQAFVRTLNDSSPEVVAEVVDALASKGSLVVPDVIRGLKNDHLKPIAVQVAIRLGPVAKPALPALTEALGAAGDDAALRREIHYALGAIGPDAKSAVPELIKSLSSDDIELVHSATYALGQIGPAANAATPVLSKQMTSDDEFTRVGAVWALLRIHPDSARMKQMAVPLLIRALGHEDEQVRAEVASALGDIGGEARRAASSLKKALQDESPLVREAAKKALGQVQGSPQ